MSSWKKAAKVNQRVHQERHQPRDRAHMGLLEKHKDYIPRARDFQRKRNTIRKLREAALNRNPDEYYHHMINSQLVEDRHTEKTKPPSEDSLDQLKVMEQKSLTYVTMKYTQEKKKVDKQLAELHFIDKPFDVQDEQSKYLLDNPKLLPALKAIKKAQQIKEKRYKTLLKRLERVKQLAVIKEKMEVRQALQKSKGSMKPKLVVEATKDRAPVYQWKYERKR